MSKFETNSNSNNSCNCWADDTFSSGIAWHGLCICGICAARRTLLPFGPYKVSKGSTYGYIPQMSSISLAFEENTNENQLQKIMKKYKKYSTVCSKHPLFLMNVCENWTIFRIRRATLLFFWVFFSVSVACVSLVYFPFLF